MKDKIDSIFYDLKHGLITEKQAHQQVLDLFAVSGMLPEYTERHIDLAYLTRVFNVVGIDGLHKEIERLKGIGKNPHDIFTEDNYR
jgi:hypothetical protein